MMEGLALRAATPGDRAFCAVVNEATLRQYVVATWGRWDPDEQRGFFDAWFDPARIRIVERDREPIGFLKTRADATAYTIDSIAIAPAHQRRGVGRAVMRIAIGEAGARPVHLQVLRVNPARGFYERLGFVAVGETPTHCRMRRAP